MKHYIITRYNYPKEYPHKEERERLFFKYTLPSIKNQTDQNFKYIIIGQTHDWKQLEDEIKGINDWVVTTRLDNDDMILPEFTKEIKNIPLQEQVIDFNGYRYDERTNKFYKDTKYINHFTSPFISLMERSENYKGVYSDQHQNMGRKFNLNRIEKRLWCQIIHDTNQLMNKRDINKQGILIQKPQWIN